MLLATALAGRGRASEAAALGAEAYHARSEHRERIAAEYASSLDAVNERFDALQASAHRQ